MHRWAALVLIVLTPGFAFGHAVGVDCRQRGKTVEVEVFYDDDSPGAQAKIDVVDAKNKIIASGIADNKGAWSFATPPPGRYVVRVDAGAGHRATQSLIVGGGAPASDAAQRAEFTGVPWLKMAIGISVIGVFAGAFLLVSFLRGGVTPRAPAPDATASSQCTEPAPPGD